VSTHFEGLMAAPPNGQGGGESGGGDDDSSGSFAVLRYRIKQQELRLEAFMQEVREERRELQSKVDKLSAEIRDAREWIIRFVSGALAVGGFLNLLALGYGFLKAKP